MSHRLLVARHTSRAALARVLAASAVLASTNLAAQQDCSCASPIFPVRWSIFASTGGALVETSGINSRLAANNYFAVSSDAIGFGGGGFGSFGPLRLGAEHVRLDGGEESTPLGRSARIGASYTTFTLGWDLRPRARLSVAPTFAVGRGIYVLTVGDRNAGATTPASPPPTFDEVLAAPGRSSRIAGGHWLYEPMLAGEMLVVRGPLQRRGLTIGLRAGYRIAPNRPDWSYRGARVPGGPIDQAKGPMLRLTFGVGGR